MTGLTQQEQKRNNPFTLEAILEEEPEIKNIFTRKCLILVCLNL